jgi:hypothetical protein
MKDMRGIYYDSDFVTQGESFDKKYLDKDCSGKWSEFKEFFLRFTDYKCPICERPIDNYADIDHYRPKNAGYPFLKCRYRNYMIMCADCNRGYKRTYFPLHNESKRATCEEELEHEKPLIVNPCVDNIYDLFELDFRVSVKGVKILVLVPHRDLLPDSYEYLKALESIRFYGLGDCDGTNSIKDCRISLLKGHYFIFNELLEAFLDREENMQKFEKIKEKVKNLNYGYYEFIAKGQFSV